MKFKTIIAAGLAVLTLIAGVGLLPASATKPPGQDHSFQVTLSTTVVGAHPVLDVNLTLCTDGTAIATQAHEYTASLPAEPFFDESTAKHSGIAVGSPA